GHGAARRVPNLYSLVTCADRLDSTENRRRARGSTVRVTVTDYFGRLTFRCKLLSLRFRRDLVAGVRQPWRPGWLKIKVDDSRPPTRALDCPPGVANGSRGCDVSPQPASHISGLFRLHRISDSG